jgi:hypothetical protein
MDNINHEINKDKKWNYWPWVIIAIAYIILSIIIVSWFYYKSYSLFYVLK